MISVKDVMNMSEKQFHIERDSTGTFTFFYDGKHRLYDEEIVTLLNEQTVEIQKLTKERNNYKGQIKQKNEKIERLQRENNKIQVHYKYDVKHLKEENEQLRQEIKQYWKCRDKWKQEAKELKKEADYFERKKCEYWNMYNEAHSDRIILKKENEQLKSRIAFFEEQEDEFETYTAQTIQNMIANYRDD